MRRFSGIIFFLFCSIFIPTVCAGAPPPKSSPSSLVTGIRGKTVALTVDQDDKPRTFCSGVWISVNLIATAGHCTDNYEMGEAIDYVTEDDPTRPRLALLVRWDGPHDVAVLEAVNPPAHGVATLASGLPVQGAPVHTMGHPLGLMWTYSTGVVAAVRHGMPDLYDTGEEMTWIQSTAPISPGNSGGGLWDSNGNLLGFCSWSYIGKAQNLNFYVPVSYLKDLFRTE